jgi:hypothetical protein
MKRSTSDMPKEKLLLKKENDGIMFLKDLVSVFYKCELVGTPERLMMAYNLLKFSIFLFKKLKIDCNLANLSSKYPGGDWAPFLASTTFKDFAWELDHELSRSEYKFMNLYL